MKVTLPRQEFVDALVAVTAVTAGRTPKAILACVHMVSEGEQIRLSGTDGEAAVCLAIACLRTDRPGEVVVSAERLLSIVRELPDAEVSLEVSQRHCVLRGQGSEFKIYVYPPEEFPPIVMFDDEPDLVIDGRVLWRMVGLTVYAAAREMSRYAINGVLWEKRGRRLFLVATDGRRLARAGGPLADTRSADFEAIVPAKALQAFDRVFAPGRAAEDWVLDVKVMPNQILLRSGDRQLSTVLVEGKFPRYEDVIPKEGDKHAVLDRLEFMSAIRRAALLTSDDARAVKMTFEAGQLTISAQSPEQGEATVKLPIEYEGEPLSVGFNPNFVNDCLKAVDLQQVHVDLLDGYRPGVITGNDRADFLYVVMPVSL